MDTHKIEELKQLINSALCEKLESFKCITGHFECTMTESSVILCMYGTKENGKKIMFWDWENSLKSAARAYVENIAADIVSCIIEIDLKKNLFVYKTINSQKYKAKLELEEKQKEQEENERKINLKNELASRAERYGKELATRVAEKLSSSKHLCYGHRDYCGMGLAVNKEGKYIYGSVWDGRIEEEKVFETKNEFVAWLSTQSDASLSNIDKDEFYWGNQVINKKRLEDFLANDF